MYDIGAFDPVPTPPVYAPKRHKPTILKKIRKKMFFSIFQKMKRARMWHMGEWMGRSLRDVKDLSLVDLLRQKKIQAKFVKKISHFPRKFSNFEAFT